MVHKSDNVRAVIYDGLRFHACKTLSHAALSAYYAACLCMYVYILMFPAAVFLLCVPVYLHSLMTAYVYKCGCECRLSLGTLFVVL